MAARPDLTPADIARRASQAWEALYGDPDKEAVFIAYFVEPVIADLNDAYREGQFDAEHHRLCCIAAYQPKNESRRARRRHVVRAVLARRFYVRGMDDQEFLELAQEAVAHGELSTGQLWADPAPSDDDDEQDDDA